MSPEEATCRAFMTAINKQTFKDLGELLDEGASLHYPGIAPVQKKRMVVMFLRQLRAKFQTLTFEIRRVIQTDGVLAVEWLNSGQRKDGSDYANEGVTIMELRDGKIRSISDYFKNHAGLH